MSKVGRRPNGINIVNDVIISDPKAKRKGTRRPNQNPPKASRHGHASKRAKGQGDKHAGQTASKKVDDYTEAEERKAAQWDLHRDGLIKGYIENVPDYMQLLQADRARVLNRFNEGVQAARQKHPCCVVLMSDSCLKPPQNGTKRTKYVTLRITVETDISAPQDNGRITACSYPS